jgi:hypothetical protein
MEDAAANVQSGQKVEDENRPRTSCEEGTPAAQ